MGKRRLEDAIAKAKIALPHVEFDVNWRPFQLNPSAPTGRGVDKQEMYIQKFGRERVEAMIPRMLATGKTTDPPIHFSYGGFTGNTFNSHRVIFAAKEMGGAALQDKVVEQLFKAYFEDEQSMGEDAVLLDYANRAGMDTTAISAILSDEKMHSDAVRQEMKSFGQHCSGVPFFIIDNKFALSGAQEADTLLDVFQQACDAK